MFFKNNYRLMQIKSIAECSKGSILQYFQPSLSYHWSLRSLICPIKTGLTVQYCAGWLEYRQAHGHHLNMTRKCHKHKLLSNRGNNNKRLNDTRLSLKR